MAKKNLAIARENEAEEMPKTQALRVEKAAETVSGELDKIIHERMRLVDRLDPYADLAFLSSLCILTACLGRGRSRIWSMLASIQMIC